jgi:hypothetical protein
VLIVVVVALVLLTTGAVTYASTRRHGPSCRGSYTYGPGIAHCNTSLIAPTRAALAYAPPVTRAMAIRIVMRYRAAIEPGAVFAAKLVGAPSTPTWIVEVHGRVHPLGLGTYAWGEWDLNATTGEVLGVSASQTPPGTWTAEVDEAA